MDTLCFYNDDSATAPTLSVVYINDDDSSRIVYVDREKIVKRGIGDTYWFSYFKYTDKDLKHFNNSANRYSEVIARYGGPKSIISFSEYETKRIDLLSLPAQNAVELSHRVYVRAFYKGTLILASLGWQREQIIVEEVIKLYPHAKQSGKASHFIFTAQGRKPTLYESIETAKAEIFDDPKLAEELNDSEFEHLRSKCISMFHDEIRQNAVQLNFGTE
jgi:hypothetical protein